MKKKYINFLTENIKTFCFIIRIIFLILYFVHSPSSVKNITIPITMWDERLSSRGAFNLSNDLNVNTTKKISKLDENSAAFILQGALDYLKR